MDKKVEFLLLKRNLQKGGFWQPITGGAFWAEDKINALKREVEEEAGIKQNGIKEIINTNYSFSFIDEDGDELQEYVYGVEVAPGQEISISKEHTQAKWVNFQDALKLLKYDSNKKALRVLYTIINPAE